MENRNNNTQHEHGQDAQGAEEFTGADPNSQSDTENKTIPEYSEHEIKRADTDPNRYANIPNPLESEEKHEAGDYDRSDYKEGDQPVQNEPSHYATDDERRLSSERKHSENSEHEIKSAIDKQQFFDGL